MNSTTSMALFQQADNTPNAAKLLSSLRHLDYSNTSAICDIVDNSIDAGAEVIRINILGEGKKNIQRIEIWDNGFGMDATTLSQAMRLGSDTEKNPQYDLGRYGMGLVTASISIGERLEVTSYRDKSVSLSIQDLDEIRETNKFIVQQQIANNDQTKEFLTNLKQNTTASATSGTCIVIEKIDRWQWTLVHASEKHLSESLGQVFRKFITAGRKIYINDNLINAIDPIHDLEPNLLAEESIDVDGEIILVKIYEAKDYGSTINTQKGINIQNQGFYILRNNREISCGQTLSLFSKHNDYNLLRAEFSFPGSLDHIVNAGFTKQNIKPELNQSFKDKLTNFVNPHLKQIRNRAKSKQILNRDKREDFSDIEKYITQKAHLLKTPLAQIEKREPKQNKNEVPTPPNANPSSPRLDITKRKHVDLNSLKVRFDLKSMTKTGPLFTPEMEKDVTVINWNADHPFYENFVLPNESNKEILNPICFLIYSLASAELRSKTDSDSEQIIENIRADLSQNLRILMNS